MNYSEWLTKQNTGEWNIQPKRAYNAGYNIAVKHVIALIEPLKAGSYEKGKQAERERIKQIITYQFGDLVSDLSDVMEQIDSGEE